MTRWRSLKSLLPSTLHKYKIASSIEATLICKKAKELIQDIIGAEPSKNIEVAYVKDGIITIKTPSSAIISEIKLYETALIEMLRDRFPKSDLNGLRFMVGPSP